MENSCGSIFDCSCKCWRYSHRVASFRWNSIASNILDFERQWIPILCPLNEKDIRKNFTDTQMETRGKGHSNPRLIICIFRSPDWHYTNKNLAIRPSLLSLTLQTHPHSRSVIRPVSVSHSTLRAIECAICALQMVWYSDLATDRKCVFDGNWKCTRMCSGMTDKTTGIRHFQFVHQYKHKNDLPESIFNTLFFFFSPGQNADVHRMANIDNARCRKRACLQIDWYVFASDGYQLFIDNIGAIVPTTERCIASSLLIFACTKLSTI